MQYRTYIIIPMPVGEKQLLLQKLLQNYAQKTASFFVHPLRMDRIQPKKGSVAKQQTLKV